MTRGLLDEAYSDEEVSAAVQTCMSIAPKIAVVVNNHSLLAIRTSEVVEGNISAYLRDNETSDDEGRVSAYGLLFQGIDRMTGCLVDLVTYVWHADGVVVAVMLSLVQHSVSHVHVGERMTISKNGRLRGSSLKLRGRAETKARTW